MKFRKEKKKDFKSAKIGIAFGGGGSRGFAHPYFLNILDKYEIKPSVIAGTSIGSIIGALYSSGYSGEEILEMIKGIDFKEILQLLEFPFFVPKDENESKVKKKDKPFELTFENLIRKIKRIPILPIHYEGILDGDGVISYLKDIITVDNIEDLEIPLKIVATNFWERVEVIIDKGDLFDAIRASISIPGVFKAVKDNDVILVDGGTTNPVPYDVIMDEVDYCIAFDVTGKAYPKSEFSTPTSIQSILNTFDILQEMILKTKMRIKCPDLLIRPDLRNINFLDFNAVQKIEDSIEKDVLSFEKTIKELIETGI